MAQPPKQHVVTHAAGWRYIFWTIVILGVFSVCAYGILHR